MRVFLLVLIIYQAYFALSEEKRGFLVTAPSTLLTDSVENICISLHNNSNVVQVSISLLGTYSGQTLAKTSHVINSVGCVELYVPKSDDQMGKLVVRLQSAGDLDLTSNSEVIVQLQANPLLVLVSTDKPIYKPGQDVLFRVVSLDHKLKPYNGKISKIWIETPTGIRVEQWTDVDVIKHGLAQLQFSLDKEPFLGQWRIKVQHSSSNTVEQTFRVEEFVPETFEVILSPPRDILPDSKNVSWSACAKYSYGETVQGDLHVEIQLQGSRAADQPNINNAVKLNRYTGCALVTVTGNELGLSDPHVHPTSVLLTATVMEKGTGISHAASVESPVYTQPFQLQFKCSQYFKPGLPYKGNVLMKTMDGRPRHAVGENIQVCVKVRYRNQLAMKLLHCWNYTTDFSSQVVFALPDISDPLNVQLISLVATAIDYPTKLYPGSAEVMVLQPTVSQNVKPWFSPSHSYIDVFTRTSLACGTSHMVSVYYSVSSLNQTTPHFFYLLESRGDLLIMNTTVPALESVVHSNTVNDHKVSHVRGWRLPVTVTPHMAPLSQLTVYYVREDGEVVAGSTNLIIDQCFQNKVRVRWSEPQVRPRSPVQLHIRASPHSVCGVSVIDRQLAFNLSRTDMSGKDNVWELLKRFNLQKKVRNQQLYCLNKVPKKEELPPTYELRRKRSLSMPPQDFAEHADAITAFDDVGVSVISNLVLETRPCARSVYPDGLYRRSWMVPANSFSSTPFIANLVLVTQQEPASQINDESLKSLIRDYFPDTWIWSLVFTGREGEVIVNSSAPDSITSWNTKVTCISEKDGLGISRSTSVSVFQPIFIHVEAPYSMKMNEKVMIKIVIYNYMHHSLPIVLRFPNNKNIMISPNEEVKLCLKELSPHSHVISVSALVARTVNLTVQAVIEPFTDCDSPDLPSKSDTIVKQLTVKHEGYIQQKSQSAFICPSEESDPSVTWGWQLPPGDNLIPDSARLQISVVADLFGPALENLDSLVLLPMGCGEQNLARLAPNLYVLKYMNAIGDDNQQLRETALKNTKKGYQRQLMFQRSDGSFSAFGDKDETGSMWLTAAVVKTLFEAQGVIDVDNDMLQKSVLWITSQQLENGCFPAIGQVFHADNEGEGPEETTTLSALVLASLAGLGTMLPPSMRSNAEFCLKTATSSTDPHLLALATLALVRLGFKKLADEALQNLLRLAIMENDLTHWGKPAASLSDNIMTTSYAVLALVELGGAQNLLMARQAIGWVSTHRNENGGFVTTQDTVVALEAVTSYITVFPPVNHTELMVIVRGDQISKTFRLSDDNKLTQQRLITNDVPTTLTATVVGDGCAVIQGVLKYNVRIPEEGGQLELQVSSSPVSTVDPCSVQRLRVCASASQTSVHMALLTIMMVTGYSVDVARLQQFTHPHLKKWEEEDGQVIFYLTDVNNLPICLALTLVRKFEVEDPLPAPVTLIDYYQPEMSTSESYSLECSPVTPLDEPLMQSDGPVNEDDRFDNFHNVDFELETPDGNEGPQPVYICPPNSTVPGSNP